MRLAPILFQTTFFPDWVSTWAMRLVVVVLPLVPVTAMIFSRTMPLITDSISGSIFLATRPGREDPLPFPSLRLMV